MSVQARRSRTNEEKLCYGCLRKGHAVKECKFAKCMICYKRHNTVLHLPEEGAKVLTVTNENNVSPEEFQKFWQIEDYPESHNSLLSIEGKVCEEFFGKRCVAIKMAGLK